MADRFIFRWIAPRPEPTHQPIPPECRHDANTGLWALGQIGAAVSRWALAFVFDIRPQMNELAVVPAEFRVLRQAAHLHAKEAGVTQDALLRARSAALRARLAESAEARRKWFSCQGDLPCEF